MNLECLKVTEHAATDGAAGHTDVTDGMRVAKVYQQNNSCLIVFGQQDRLWSYSMTVRMRVPGQLFDALVIILDKWTREDDVMKHYSSRENQ